MSAGDFVTVGPVAVVHLARLCPPAGGATPRYDLHQVRFGRDADGCYAAASDFASLAVARWDPHPDATPGGWEFGVASGPLAGLSRLLARRSMRHFADRLRAASAPPAVETVPPGRSAASVRVTTDPPGGRFPPLAALDRAMRFPPPAPPADGPRLNANLVAGLMALADLVAPPVRSGGMVRPFLGAPAPAARHATPACWEVTGTPTPLPMNLRLWLMLMPLKADPPANPVAAAEGAPA